MSLELLNTFATLGTFVVIAATAIAALVQLRHARHFNQIEAISALQDAITTPEFVAAQHYVLTGLANDLKDPEFRYQLNNSRARTGENQVANARVNAIGNFYENLGLLVRMDLVERDLALNMWSSTASEMWSLLSPVVGIGRRELGETLWENYEYFMVLSKKWLAAHPKGDYPAGFERLGVKDEFLEADRQYAASRATT